MKVYLDIETIPAGDEIDPMSMTPPKNMSKKETIDKWFQEKAPQQANEEYRKRALSPLEGQILCIGFAINNEEPIVLTGRNLCSLFYNELENILKSYPNEVLQKVYYVGWNIREFDLPFIRMHSIKEKSFIHQYLPRKKYDDRIIDLQDWFITSNNRYVSQDSVCKFLGIEGKGDDIDGSKVYDYYLQDRIPEIAEYCARDVKTIQKIDNIVNLDDRI